MDLITTITKEMVVVDFQNPENRESQFVRNDKKHIMQIRLITSNRHKFVFVGNVEREKANVAKNSLEKKYLIQHYILMS